MKKQYKMNIVPVGIPVSENFPYLTSLLYPINTDTVMTCTELLSPEAIKAIESVANIYDISKDIAEYDATHIIRCHSGIIVSSNLHCLS